MIVQKLSITIADKITTIIGTPEQRNILAYGAEILLGGFIKLVSLVAFSFLFGLFPTALLVILSSAIFRILSGGVHFSTYYRCLIFSIVIFMSLGALVEGITIYFSKGSFLVFNLIVLIFLNIIIFKWVPAGNENRLVECPKRRKRFKVFSMALVNSIFLSISLISLNSFSSSGIEKYLIAVVIGLFWQGFTLTPLAYYSFGKIEELIDTINRREEKKNVKEVC